MTVVYTMHLPKILKIVLKNLNPLLDSFCNCNRVFINSRRNAQWAEKKYCTAQPGESIRHVGAPRWNPIDDDTYRASLADSMTLWYYTYIYYANAQNTRLIYYQNEGFMIS